MDNNGEMLKKATLVKLALRTNGLRVLDPIEGVGETIKENVNGLYQINQKEEVVSPIPNEIVIYQDITTKLVINSKSPFSLRKSGNDFYLYSDFVDEPLMKVGFSKRPEHYGLKTSRGIPMKYVGQVMGRDCLAIAVDKQCTHFQKGKSCKYCNINPTNFTSHLPRFSDEGDIAELIRAVGKNYRFIDLTGGTFEDRDEECRVYTKIGNVIRDNIGRRTFSGPFSLSPPNDLNLLEKLFKTNVDVISFNMDVWNKEILRKVCPGKFEIGKEQYERALLKARELWGEGNSVMQFLAGPWESNQSLLEGTKYYLDKGILVNITTFYPSPGSSFQNLPPKGLSELVNLYIDYGELVKTSGLYPNSRHSILTSESGNRSSIVNEVVKGYLTKSNFDKSRDLDFFGGYKNE